MEQLEGQRSNPPGGLIYGLKKRRGWRERNRESQKRKSLAPYSQYREFYVEDYSMRSSAE